MFNGVSAGAFVHEGVLQDGTILARFPEPNSSVQLTGYFVEVALSEGPTAGDAITVVTTRSRMVTEKLLKQFGRFFPGAPSRVLKKTDRQKA
jgi:hypothetical protein